jgi:hypothetical protein
VAKRQTKRKVVIAFKGRSPEDPKRYLDAVEEVFRPREIHVHVESGEQEAIDHARTIPDDELAQKAKNHAAVVLDLKDRQFREMQADLAQLKIEPESWAKREKAKRSALAEWLKKWAKHGWRFTARVVVPAVIKEAVKKAFGA